MSKNENPNIAIIRDTLKPLVNHPKAFCEKAKDFLNAAESAKGDSAKEIQKDNKRIIAEEKEVLSYFSECIRFSLDKKKPDTALKTALLKLNKSSGFRSFAREAVLEDLKDISRSFANNKEYGKVFEIVKVQNSFITEHPMYFNNNNEWMQHLAVCHDIGRKIKLDSAANIELADAITRFQVSATSNLEDGIKRTSLTDCIALNGLHLSFDIAAAYLEKGWQKPAVEIMQFTAIHAKQLMRKDAYILEENAYDIMKDIRNDSALSREAVLKAWKENVFEVSVKKRKNKKDRNNNNTAVCKA